MYSTIHKKVVAYLYNINEIRFFYKKSPILSENRDFEKSQESVLQFVLQFNRKIVLKSEK